MKDGVWVMAVGSYRWWWVGINGFWELGRKFNSLNQCHLVNDKMITITLSTAKVGGAILVIKCVILVNNDNTGQSVNFGIKEC